MDYQDNQFRKNEKDIFTSHTQGTQIFIDGLASETQSSLNTSPFSSKNNPLMWLIVVSPRNVRGTVLPVSSGAMIGRHGDIVWHDARMSRKHAKFLLINDPDNPTRKVFSITPHQDRNGTFVNGQRITTNTPLKENDIILLGDTQFIVKVLA